MSDSRELVAKWFAQARRSPGFSELGFESAHIDQLVEPFDSDELLRGSLDLFEDLVEGYRAYSTSIMAMLVITTGDSEQVDLRAPLMSKSEDFWDGYTPPELYIIDRKPQLTPYRVDEFKLCLDDICPEPSYGTCYSYYRCHRQDDQVGFSRAIYFEHYPAGS